MSVLFSVLFILFINFELEWPEAGSTLLKLSPIFGLGVVPAAWFLWPTKKTRTSLLMAHRGFWVVFCSLLMFATCVTVVSYIMNMSSQYSAGFSAESYLWGIFGFMVFGSILTFGIPYFIGIFVAILFAEPADHYLK